MVNHYNIRAFGCVQNIGFRHSGKVRADELGVAGYIKNQPDGSVYIEAEASQEKLKQFIDWCGRGPALAQVKKIEVSEAPLVGYVGFGIRQSSG
ncbi:hypothetical protein A3H09_02165 [Candidatus Falkowbacteria bacterium RIFCSPLOWO2_12_FULL_45_13]|uniref:acylphosphatase n=1 Tax=Candidatus Falkowbacteria bacterium RIFCSPLOWO2_12_FULL_45_13 TaxID=1797991 RepID=A0A1F5SUS0_9BACT|nr:MAG: hypothetical protein A3H09_02165 [Candidatus Falkowbacteria bacterium RIFCSPLOWO2_12_FULL_45_13]